LLPGLAILLLLEFCLREGEGERERKRAAYTHKNAAVCVISEIMNNNQF